MLKQKEYDFLMKKFEQNNMEGYEEWFNQNINSEIKDETKGEAKWIKGIRLQNSAMNHVLIAVKYGIVLKVEMNDFRMIV